VFYLYDLVMLYVSPLFRYL